MTEFSSLILAPGEGKRMKSTISKVVHKVCGREMINHVIDAANDAGSSNITVVVDHFADQIRTAAGDRAKYVTQTAKSLTDNENVLVLWGNMPLITAQTLKNAVALHIGSGNDVTLIKTQEHNTFEGECIYCFKSEALTQRLDTAEDELQQKQCFFSAAEHILQSGGKVGTYIASDPNELLCVEDRVQLSCAEKIMRRRINERFMRNGVTIIDPDNTYICSSAQIGIDTVIYPGTVIEGNTVIGNEVYVGANCKLTDAVIADGVDINISTIIKSCVGKGTHVGPYAYIRPDCTVGEGCKVGDFVELKKAQIGNGTKLSHLTYVGDAEVGSGVNFGCGTVTVNYDGKKKYKTVIKDNSFIGCNTNLVSPVTVNEGAYIAAGSTITDDVPADNLAIARARQVNKSAWSDRRKK